MAWPIGTTTVPLAPRLVSGGVPDGGRPRQVEEGGALWLEDVYVRAGRVAPAVVVARESALHMLRTFISGGPLGALGLRVLAGCRLAPRVLSNG